MDFSGGGQPPDAAVTLPNLANGFMIAVGTALRGLMRVFPLGLQRAVAGLALAVWQGSVAACLTRSRPAGKMNGVEGQVDDIASVADAQKAKPTGNEAGYGGRTSRAKDVRVLRSDVREADPHPRWPPSVEVAGTMATATVLFV